MCAHLYQKMAKRGTDTKYTEFVFVVVHDIESTFIFFLCVSMGIYSGNKSEWNVNEWKFLHWQFFFPSIYITLINQCQTHADCNWCVCVFVSVPLHTFFVFIIFFVSVYFYRRITYITAAGNHAGQFFVHISLEFGGNCIIMLWYKKNGRYWKCADTGQMFMQMDDDWFLLRLCMLHDFYLFGGALWDMR